MPSPAMRPYRWRDRRHSPLPHVLRVFGWPQRCARSAGGALMAALLVLVLSADCVQAQQWMSADIVFRTEPHQAARVAEVMWDRLRADTPDASVEAVGENVRVTVVSVDDVEALVSMLRRRGVFSLHRVSSDVLECPTTAAGVVCVADIDRDRRALPLLPPELGEGAISKAAGVLDYDGRPALTLQLSAEAGEVFGEMTSSGIGERIAIVVDDRILTAPTVQSPIYGGSVQISGDFTQAEVAQLVAILSAAPLPAPVEVISVETAPAEPPKRSLLDWIRRKF